MPAECTQITRQPGVKQHTYVLAPGEMETAFYLAYLTPWRLKVLPQRVYRDLVSHRFYRGIISPPNFQGFLASPTDLWKLIFPAEIYLRCIIGTGKISPVEIYGEN